MPLPRWLQSLIPRKPSQTSARPPPRGEGWGGGQRSSTATQVQSPPTPDPSPPGGGEAHATTDNSHRIHIAANDPAFPAKREAAITLICAAITDIATPMGYTRKGTTWARETQQGRTAIHLQRSRYGFTAHISLRFLAVDGISPGYGVWAQDDEIRLMQFYLPNEGQRPESGDLVYLDLHDDPASLDRPMHILATRALPWLDAHLTASVLPEIERYLPR